MTSITLHGAVGEIGGNKILVEDNKTKLFFDFGLSFNKWGDYFSPFLQPRKFSSIRDFFVFGLLPDMEGLYRKDLENRFRKSKADPQFDGVVLSHPHLDHAGFISYIRPDIPIYSSVGCKAILKAIEETGYGYQEFIKIKETFKIRESKTDKSKLVRDKESVIQRTFRNLEPKIEIDDIAINSFPVDHSVPGANSFVIETSEGAVVYTGDIRFHGRRAGFSKEFVKKAARFDPIAMITEGTRVGEPTSYGELELKDELTKKISEVKELVIANFPVRDMDRMYSFVEAAKDNDRSLVINLKQAYTLRELTKSNVPGIPDLDQIKVFIPRKKWGILDDDNYPRRIQMQDYRNWEREFLESSQSVTAEDLRKNPKKYIYRCDFYELNNLFDIKPPAGSIYIRSVTEPVDEEMEMALEKEENWLKQFGLYPYQQIHCSGHASGHDIKEMIDEIAPKNLIPIHTETPEVFHSFHTKVIQKDIGVKIILK